MKKITLVFFVIGTIMQSCNSTKTEDTNNEARLLQLTTDSLLTALSSKNADLLVKYYDTNALFISAQSGLHTGREDIKKAYAAGFDLPGLYIEGSIKEIKIAKSGDMGYTLVPWDSYFMPEPEKKSEMKGLNVLVWKKQEDGTWRVIIDKP